MVNVKKPLLTLFASIVIVGPALAAPIQGIHNPDSTGKDTTRPSPVSNDSPPDRQTKPKPVTQGNSPPAMTASPKQGLSPPSKKSDSGAPPPIGELTSLQLNLPAQQAAAAKRRRRKDDDDDGGGVDREVPLQQRRKRALGQLRSDSGVTIHPPAEAGGYPFAQHYNDLGPDGDDGDPHVVAQRKAATRVKRTKPVQFVHANAKGRTGHHGTMPPSEEWDRKKKSKD